MAIAPTDWKARVSPLDARDESGRVMVWELLAGSDDEVALNLSAQLAPSESLTQVSRTLWQLRAQGETADTDAASKLAAAITVASPVVIQRIQGLDRGRYYRLEVVHGELGNRRGASLLIHCPE